jgi:hypothetical protein
MNMNLELRIFLPRFHSFLKGISNLEIKRYRLKQKGLQDFNMQAFKVLSVVQEHLGNRLNFSKILI